MCRDRQKQYRRQTDGYAVITREWNGYDLSFKDKGSERGM